MNKFFSFDTRVSNFNIKNIVGKAQKIAERKAVETRQFKDIINKTLKRANARLASIGDSKIASPAYKAVMQEFNQRRNNYSVFSIANIDLTTKGGIEKAKYIYGRALKFLNNPTSKKPSARHYIQEIADRYKMPFEMANEFVDTATDPQLINGKIAVNNWDSEKIRQLVDDYMNEVNRSLSDFKDANSFQIFVNSKKIESLDSNGADFDIW